MPQEEIEEIIVEKALLGLSVLRLKGGDPFVFGRGGEEAMRLKEAGIRYEIVPGVTAGIAAPAHAGVPVDLTQGVFRPPSRSSLGTRGKTESKAARRAAA